MKYIKTFKEYGINENILVIGDEYGANYAILDKNDKVLFKGSRREMIEYGKKNKISNIEHSMNYADKNGKAKLNESKTLLLEEKSFADLTKEEAAKRLFEIGYYYGAQSQMDKSRLHGMSVDEVWKEFTKSAFNKKLKM